GEFVRTTRTAANEIKIIALVGFSCVAFGWALNPLIPIVMKIWTASYGVAWAGFACLMFLVFFWLIAVRGLRRWSFPFVVIGMNAVFIYMSESIIPWRQTVGIFTSPLESILGSFTTLFQAILVLA